MMRQAVKKTLWKGEESDRRSWYGRKNNDWRVESLRKFLKKESGGIEPKPGNKLKLLRRIATLLQARQKHE